MTLRLKVLELVQQGKTVPEIKEQIRLADPAVTRNQFAGLFNRLRRSGLAIDGGPRSEGAKHASSQRTAESYRKIAEARRASVGEGAKALEVARQLSSAAEIEDRARKLFVAAAAAPTGDQTVALPETRYCDGGHIVPLDYAASKRAAIAGPTLAPRPNLAPVKPPTAPTLSNLRCLWTDGEDWRTWKLCEARCADGKPFCPEHAKRGLIRRQVHVQSVDHG